MGERTITTEIEVAGCKYHQAPELAERGALRVGIAVTLRSEPDNPSDCYAVGVHVLGEQIGHIKRGIAPKYQQIVDQGRFVSANIKKISQKAHAISVDVQYRATSLEWFREDLPTSAAVYHVTLGGSFTYVGSTFNLQRRCYQHLRQLVDGCHHNRGLQRDFGDGSGFKISGVWFPGVTSEDDLRGQEAAEIMRLRQAGRHVYNATEDGQGFWSPEPRRHDTLPEIREKGISLRTRVSPATVAPKPPVALDGKATLAPTGVAILGGKASARFLAPAGVAVLAGEASARFDVSRKEVKIISTWGELFRYLIGY